MTLNQVIKTLKGIANNHRQIRHFYFGDPAEWAAADKQFPACLVTLSPARLTNEGSMYDFTFYLSDVVGQVAEDVNHAEYHANTVEVQSDMVEVLEDLVAAIDSPRRPWTLRTQEVPAELYDLLPIGNDLVAGVKAELTLQVMKPRNCATIPALPGSDLNDGGVDVGGDGDGGTGGGGSEGYRLLLEFRVGDEDAPMGEGDATFTHADLVNKKVVVYADGDYLSHIPGENERHIIKELSDNFITFPGGVNNREKIAVYVY